MCKNHFHPLRWLIVPLLIGSSFFLPQSTQAQSFDLSDILNGNVSGTYEKIEVTNVANTASLVFENITIQVDASTTPPTVTSITLESGTFTYAGLEASITDASYDPGAQEFTATASVKFPEDLTIAVQFSISHSGVQVLGGRINLPDFEVGNVGVKNAYVEYYSQDDKLGGGAEMTVPGLGADPSNPATIAGSIEIQHGQLVMFAITASGLKIPLGNTDAFLDTIGVRGDNLNDFDKLSLSGTLGIVGGPEIGSTYTFEVDTVGTVWPAHGWIDINGTAKLYGVTTGTASFAYRPPYNITVGAEANFINVFIATFSAGIDSSGVSGSAEGKLQIPSSVPIVGGYTMADAKAALHNTDFSGSVSITITPEVPEACIPSACADIPYAYPCPSWSHPFRWCSGSKQVCTPEVCTPRIPSVQASAGFTFSNGSFSFSTKTVDRIAPWEIPYNEAFTVNNGNAQMQFMTNWSRIQKTTTSGSLQPFALSPTGEPVTAFTIDSTMPAAIFRITYANPETSGVSASLTLPTGTVLSITDGPLPSGFSNVTGFSRFNPDAREAFFFLFEPSQGDYTVTLENTDVLGDFSVELLAQNHEPRVEIVQLKETGTAGVYQLDWIDEDPDDNAVVRIYLDTDREGENGYLLATLEEDNETNSIQLDTNTAEVQPGFYFVFITVDDGKNSQAVAYSSKRIWVDNGNHPAPVTQIAIGSGDSEFTVEWEYEESPNVNYFTILYTTDDHLTLFAQHVTVKANVRSHTVTGLENGVPLLVSVVAIDERGYSSAATELLRVVPSPGVGYTPPIIVSTPDPDATVGNLYFYLPMIFDADSLLSSNPDLDEGVSTTPNISLHSWELITAPEGMNIDSEVGLITWTPSENQVGDHAVVLQLTESVYPEDNNQGEDFPIEPNIALQAFIISVHSSDNTNGVEFNPYKFFSSPILFAYEETLYQYQVALLAPQGASVDYVITEGPSGMTIDEQGLVTWNVPANTSGEYVHITAIVNGELTLEQDYYLHVVTAKNSIPSTSNIQILPWETLH